MVKPRSDFPISREIATEILGEILSRRHRERNTGPDKFETRHWARRLVDWLAEQHVGFVRFPTVVPLDGGAIKSPVSDAATRRAACDAWDKTLARTGRPADAFWAALDVTLERQPAWSVEDAARHTIAFVLPPDMKRGG